MKNLLLLLALASSQAFAFLSGPAASGGGAGDVAGPASSTDNFLAVFDGATGKAIKQSTASILTTGGNMGLGNTTPSDNRLSLYKLWDGSGNWSNFDASLVVNAAGAGGDGFYQQGAYVNVRANHNSGTLDLLRNYLTAELSGDGVVTEAYGLRGIARVYDVSAPGDTSAGTLVNGFGLEAYVGNVATGGAKIRNATGIYISRAQAIGTDAGHDHTAIGLRIDSNIDASGGDNNYEWAIKSESTAASQFLGPIYAASILPYDNYTNNVGSYSDPFGLAYLGGVKFRGNSYELLIETNNLSENYTIRMPDTLGVAGQALVINSGSNLGWRSVSDVAIQTTGSKPTCESAIRGKLWVTQGGAGVADIMQVCIKNAADAYEWNTFTIAP